MTRVGFLQLAILFSLVAACEGRILPSRAMVVDLSVTEANREEVAALADGFFRARGFVLSGRDGYEVLTDQHLSNRYSHPGGIGASVSWRNDEEVYIRINTEADRWNSEANDLFERLASRLDAQWPDAVQKERIPAGE